MKQSIRFFSIGLLTSTILSFGYYFFFDNKDNLETVSVEKMISQLEIDGYRVITEDEFISYSLMNETESNEETNKEPADTDVPKEENNSDAKDENADEEDKKDEVKKVTFTTKKGVVSQDIADILMENNIIDDRRKFLDYLDDNDYSSYIQLGKFTVTSEMSFKELAETITTYPGN